MVWFVFKIHLLLDANAKFSGQVHLLADKDFIAINMKIEEDQIEYIIILERETINTWFGKQTAWHKWIFGSQYQFSNWFNSSNNFIDIANKIEITIIEPQKDINNGLDLIRIRNVYGSIDGVAKHLTQGKSWV